MVYSNTIQSLVAILRAMPNLGISFTNNEREVSAPIRMQNAVPSAALGRDFSAPDLCLGAAGGTKARAG